MAAPFWCSTCQQGWFTLHAKIAKAAVEAEVTFNVPSVSAYVSTTLSADNVVFAVVLATASLHH